MNLIFQHETLLVFGLSDCTRPTSKRTPGRPPFHPKQVSTLELSYVQRAYPLPADISAHDHGRLRSSLVAAALVYLALRRPDCTFSRLTAFIAEEYDRPVTQSIATPEPGCPGPHPRSSRPEADGLVQGELPPISPDRFHQPCLLTGRTSRIGEDCRPRTAWRPLTLFGQLGSSFSASHWRFLPRRLDGTTAGC